MTTSARHDANRPNADKRDAKHRAANRGLVPWALRLLEGNVRKPGFQRVSLRVADADSLTAEARDRLVEALPMGVLRFLTHAGGWRAVSLPAAPGSERIREGVRLSAPRVWEQFSLSFSARSLSALVEGFEFDFIRHRTSHHRTSRVAVSSRGQWTGGDLLTAHLVRWYLRQADYVPGTSLAHNPLSAVAADVGLRPEGADCAAVFDRLMPVLPWLARHVGRSWFGLIEEMISEPNHLASDCEALAEAVRGWRQEAVRRGRPDLLVAAVETTRLLFDARQMAHRLQTRLGDYFGDAPLARRQEQFDVAAQPLRELLAARQVYLDCRAAPPIDRDAAQIILMRECERADAPELWEQLDALVADLEGRIS